jgi:fructosamine-3-kinase
MDDLFVKFCAEYDSTARIMIETYTEMAKSVAMKILDEKIRNRALAVLKDPMKEFPEIVLGNLAEPYATLCHGDCWNNNIMYLTDEVCRL